MRLFPTMHRVMCRPLTYKETKKYEAFEPGEHRVILAEVLLAGKAPGDEEIPDFEASEFEHGQIVVLDYESTYKMKVNGADRLIVFEDDILARLEVEDSDV